MTAIGTGDEAEAGVEVGAEVEMVDAEAETVEVGTVEMIEGLPLLPPSPRLLPLCRASVTILAASFPYFDGVAFR